MILEIEDDITPYPPSLTSSIGSSSSSTSPSLNSTPSPNPPRKAGCLSRTYQRTTDTNQCVNFYLVRKNSVEPTISKEATKEKV
jgi:hypothetical protein